jgi:hypothetical protein
MRLVRSILTRGGGGSTHRSLADTGGGYSIRGVIFPYTTPRPSRPMVSTFHIMAPPDIQFNHNLPKVLKFKFREPMAATWSSDHSTIYCGPQLLLAITNDLSLAIGSTRVDWKVSLIQIRYSFNSYNLMHKQEL